MVIVTAASRVQARGGEERCNRRDSRGAQRAAVACKAGTARRSALELHSSRPRRPPAVPPAVPYHLVPHSGARVCRRPHARIHLAAICPHHVACGCLRHPQPPLVQRQRLRAAAPIASALTHGEGIAQREVAARIAEHALAWAGVQLAVAAPPLRCAAVAWDRTRRRRRCSHRRSSRPAMPPCALPRSTSC